MIDSKSLQAIDSLTQSWASNHTVARRDVLKGIALLISAPMLPSWLSSNVVYAEEENSLSLEKFYEFSQSLTQVQSLDRNMCEKMYQIFKKESWGMSHLQRVYRKVVEIGTVRTDEVLNSLDEGEHWFLGHFLTTWITGIYYHDSGNLVVSYEHALMYASFTDLRPVPGFSARDFGFWKDAPQGHA
ncbi:MAG: hypothetical protein HQM07_02925 [Zetaproteobacteria bacterium]|nr:hypothetical protein [Zetaproteobacteria bacterium]